MGNNIKIIRFCIGMGMNQIIPEFVEYVVDHTPKSNIVHKPYIAKLNPMRKRYKTKKSKR